MNRVQKMAWFIVIVIISALLVSLTAFVILYVKFGWSRTHLAYVFMGLVGLGGIAPLVFREGKNKVILDERDQLIKRNAALAGFTAAFLVAGLGCMIPFCILGSKGMISVKWLPKIWLCTFLSAFFVQSVAILVLYGRESDDGNSQAFRPTEVEQ